MRASAAPPRGPCGQPASPPAPAQPLVTVIVPTLQEETTLPSLLDHLAGLSGRFELVVSDGGSTDATLAVARAHPLAPRVVEATGGRARQLNIAARSARGELLLFLHADSRLPPDAYGSLARAWRDPSVAGGNFALSFEGEDLFARVLTTVYAAQRRLGYFYGDSSIWVRRETFRALGGFRELPVMEDYDFGRRLARHGRVARLAGPATTSSRRWRQAGVARTVLAWTTIRWLYLLGVPAERLAGLYRHAR
jgi:rSAM/selenodomain-associated transferase 2